MRAAWWAQRVKPGEPGRADPRVLRMFQRFIEPVVRLMHRPVLEDVERLPLEGPYMLVANHSGAMAASEIFSFVACYVRQVGTERRLAGLAHPFGLALWPFSYFVKGMGAIPSSYAAAEAALGQGVPVLVFPGGDHESTRPVWQANRVTFGGRRGFLKIARRCGVPIVPMGISGSHYSVPILWRSRVLPWLMVIPPIFGLTRMPVTVLGVAVAVVLTALLAPRLGGWVTAAIVVVWLASPLTMLPWVPSTIRMRIGEPIPPETLFGSGDAERGDAGLDAAYLHVETAVQRLVTPDRASRPRA